MTIAVLGLGGAGGNIANEAAKLGLQTAAINFSQRDLNAADAVKHKLKVPGSEGVGHDRELAITLMQEHYDMVVQFVQEHFGNHTVKVIAVPFATGGGSGAGMAPILMDVMMALLPDKVFIAIPVLPGTSEGAVSQMNCSATIAELLKLDVCVLPVDNSKVAGGKSRVYEETNNRVAGYLYDLMSFTEMESKNGNFDRTDLCTLFRQKGIAAIAEVELATLPKSIDLSPQGIAASIRASWDETIFAPIDFSIVRKAALIYDGQESILDHFDTGLIFEPFAAGNPLDLFEGFYHTSTGRVLTVLTGLTFPKDRFEQIDALIEESTSRAEVALDSEAAEYTPKTVNFDQRLRKVPVTATPARNVTDILSKYRR
jgi:cell division GTPase FtsZ